VPERRTARRTRAAILAAAESVFAAAGLAGARIDAIAAAAGVNKALLYYYSRARNGLHYRAEEQFRESTGRRWRF